ncbi:HAD family hydrolase [Novosphingobium resinovorum]
MHRRTRRFRRVEGAHRRHHRARHAGRTRFRAGPARACRAAEGLSTSAIDECLATRIRPMPGAKVLVETLKKLGCHTVLVTGGFHHFADPVAEMLGFEHVVGNRLEVADGKLTGGLVGGIVDRR